MKYQMRNLLLRFIMVYSNNEVTGTNLEEVRRATANDHVLELGEKIENG